MRTYKLLLILFVSFLLSSCVASTSNVKADKALLPTEGVVVTKLVSNWKGYNNPLLAQVEFVYRKSTASLNSGKFSLSKANDFKVVSLPAGLYKWSHLSFGSRHIVLAGEFEVKPGKITYIGDINSNLNLRGFGASAKINVVNKSNEARTLLQAQYPDLLVKHPFVTDVTDLKP